eukprot:snap_masked-scaffold_15-processed-gene-9.20-mRNA-1 protein AED:1.00 eAED:1.00 QI:0/-1/0/0/-1/1/1/0/579
MMKLLSNLVIVINLFKIVFGSYEVFEPVTVELRELESFADNNGNLLRRVKEGLTSSGLISISGVKNIHNLRKKLSESALDCMKKLEGDEQSIIESLLPDGTHRTTFAASNQGESLTKFRREMLKRENKACLSFLGSFETLQHVLNDLAEKVAVLLDSACDAKRLMAFNPIKKLVYDETYEPDSFHSVQDLVHSRLALQHTHVFHNLASESNKRALDFHLDKGLFLLFLPAVYSNGETSFDFFTSVEGRIMTPDFGQEDDVVVFMAGDAMEQLINPTCAFEIKPTLHAVKFSEQLADISRVWSGLMVLPPSSAVYQKNSFFKSAPTSVAENLALSLDNERSSAIGCSHNMQLTEVIKGGCKANEVYCWMQCMPLTHDVNPNACAQKGEVMKCADPNGVPWKDGMCTDCTLRCMDEDTGPSTSSGNKLFSYDSTFCNGLNSVMYMNGFTLDPSRRPDDACLVILFDGLVASNFWSYWFLVFCSFCIGISVEYVLYRRKRYHNASRQTGKQYRNNSLLLHFIQVAISYAAMLIAMTYSLAMMISVCSGVVAGHYLFNFKDRIQDVEACCAFMEDLSDKKSTL